MLVLFTEVEKHCAGLGFKAIEEEIKSFRHISVGKPIQHPRGSLGRQLDTQVQAHREGLG